MSSPKLYSSQNIDEMSWPTTSDGEYAKNFLTPLIKNGVQHYIDNIETEMRVLQIDDLALPVTINNTEYHNSYVCSPYGQYVSYAQESLTPVKSKLLKKLLSSLLWGLGKLLKLGKANKVIIVNNWMFSTNLYPKLTHEQIKKITEFLKIKFPEHAIIFRSIHTYGKENLFQSLERNHFELIASRLVFFMDTENENIFTSRIFKSDLKLLRESEYQTIYSDEIPESEIEKITTLYRSVYLDRHSTLNPQLNRNFIKLALLNQVLSLKALKNNQGQIDVVVGYFHRNGIMTSPLLGYDVSQPQSNGLYRLASTILTLEAKKQQKLFHLSSGAAFYKKIRKAEGNIEYTAVYNRHLSIPRRFPWFVLKSICNSVGIMFMKKFDH